MLKVKFLIGFQGTETGNIWYEPGDTLELDDDMAIILVQHGRAELVMEIQPEQPEPAPYKAARKRRGK